MPVTQALLEGAMIFHLRNFASGDNADDVSNETIHNTILKDDDGFGNATSKRLYKGIIRWTLDRNGDNDLEWPDKWMEMSVSALAERLTND